MNIEELKAELINNDLTLIGVKGLDNIEFTLRKVKENNIIGDFVETGVWKGGACIYAKAVIDQLEIPMTVYVCDSFQGLPQPNIDKYPADTGDIHHTLPNLSVSLEAVKQTFEKYKTEAIFVKGWFSDTMPVLKTEIKSIAVLRLDGDMYESTINVLENLYDLVPKGGYIIIDDYCLFRAAQAVDDFRTKRGIQTPLVDIDHCIKYWEKE